MNSKTFKTKTFWGALALFITGAGQISMGDVGGGIQSIAAALTAMFVRDAITKIEPPAGG